MKKSSEVDMDLNRNQKLKQQINRFVVVGCIAVITDFICYYFLLTIFPPTIAKTISFITGTILAYTFNKYWTFEKPNKSHTEMLKFFILYAITLSANVGVNTLTLHLFPQYLILAFLCATGTSTVLNFIGQKWWVFKTKI